MEKKGRVELTDAVLENIVGGRIQERYMIS